MSYPASTDRWGLECPPEARNREEAAVTDLTRRSVLHGSLALAAARPFAAPHIARAATTTATVWFAQGFVQDEDVALRKAEIGRASCRERGEVAGGGGRWQRVMW